MLVLSLLNWLRLITVLYSIFRLVIVFYCILLRCMMLIQVERRESVKIVHFIISIYLLELLIGEIDSLIVWTCDWFVLKWGFVIRIG